MRGPTSNSEHCLGHVVLAEEGSAKTLVGVGLKNGLGSTGTKLELLLEVHGRSQV